MNDQRASYDLGRSTPPVPLIRCRTDGAVRELNAAAGALLDRSSDEVVGRPLGELIRFEDEAREACDRAELLAGTRVAYVARANVGPEDGQTVQVVVTGTPATDTTVSELLVQLESIQDVGSSGPAQVPVRRQHALHDPLTGLPTRALLLDRIRAATRRADRHDQSFACLFIDLDRFKHVNDTYGHAVGDRVLIQVVERARQRLRSPDTLSRLGGDEFVVVIEELDRTRVRDVVEDICASLLELLRAPVHIDHLTVDVSASIGVAVSSGGDTAEELLNAADVAMYDAKAAGRDCWRMHDPTMSTPGRTRHRVHELLRTAMASQRVVVLHQPVVDLRDGASVGVEALARLQHEDGSVSEPRTFIPVAEATGMIHELGQRVLQIAAASADRTGSAWLAVNVSPRQLAERDFERTVVEVLGTWDIDPGRIVFDITESDQLELDDPHSVSNLRRLSERGIRFALDDFGRGSSLHRFRHLPVSFIKLDQSFVDGVANVGSGDLAVVRAVLGMAESMGVPVIAEGVETALQRQILRQVGVPLAQGYLFARPAPPLGVPAATC